jgi:conjugative relaxase-like TrwC/TraI family protein
MLIINSASSAGIAYWERSALRSAWLGRGAALLGLSGPVTRDDLRQVLRGEQPGRGEALTPRPWLRRREGWDLVFAAPKSVSLLAAAEPAASGPIGSAFEAAVADAFALLERRAAWARQNGGLEPVAGVVAAAFLHLHNDAGQPHLHSHAVLSNLGKQAGAEGWRCLVANRLWHWREALGPAFQMALRARIRAAGFSFDWELSRGGIGEIRQVPARWRGAASSRSLASRAGAIGFGSTSPAAARAARARSRSRGATARPGEKGEKEAVGLPLAQVDQILEGARTTCLLPAPPPSKSAVERALAQQGSTFDEPKVLAALGETTPAGMGVGEAAAWARRFCEASIPTRGKGRWTTELALELDQKVLRAVGEARRAHLAEVSPVVAAAVLNELGFAGEAAKVASELACSGAGISVVPRGPWLAQAACVDTARAIWQAGGYQVHVEAPGELSYRRWLALTSLRPRGAPGGGQRRSASQLAGCQVVVVDAADYLGPAELYRLVEVARASAAKLVLVPGGTAPPRQESSSRSMEGLAQGRLALGEPPRAGSGAPWPPGSGMCPGVAAPGLLVSGAFSGHDTMAHVVAAWLAGARDWLEEASTAATKVAAPQGLPLMVAFGRDEVDALNLAAREAWSSLIGAATAPARPEAVLGWRAYRAGDQVMALRRSGEVPSATRGAVVAVDPAGAQVIVEWRLGGEPRRGAGRGPGRPRAFRQVLGPRNAADLGYGYATTMPYLRALRRPAPEPPSEVAMGPAALFVLGDPLQLGGLAVFARSAWVTLSAPGVPAFGPAGAEARRRWGIAELATSWPDAELLEIAGPRPLQPAKQQHWAQQVANHALSRALGYELAPVPRPLAEPGLRRGRAPSLIAG